MAGPTQLDDRQVVNRAPLSALGNTANETLDVIMGDINTFFANATYLPTASVLMTRDVNANTQANNFLEGFATTATGATTTTLTVASKAFQQFTGTSTQTVVLPAANSLTLGQSFTIANRSTGNVTVQNATPTTLQVMTVNSQAIFTVTNVGSSAGSWDISYTVTGPVTFLQTQVTTDSTTTGSASTLQTADISFGVARLTNASLVSVSGIPAGASGQQFIIENQTGNTITINNNDSGATAANRIFTGTGGSVSMASNASFEFVYDTTQSMWMLIGGTGSGSGSGSGKNYLSVYTASTSSGVPNTGNGNFELGSTTGWALGTIGTLTNGLPTGSPTFGSGASGNLSISTISGGTQIAGSYSLSYASSAATTQGNMLASAPFFIDAEDQAKVQTVKFYYKVASGASAGNFSGTSSNSFAWAIYDVTNSAWLGTAGQFGMTQNSGSGYVTGTFQTAINTTELRFVLYNANASSGAITLYLDDISVGPQTAPIGPAMTDWVAYTPTFTGFGTITTSAYWSRRVGDSLEVHGYFSCGTPTATPNQITIGYNGANGNVVIDTTKVAANLLVGDAGGPGFATTFFRYGILGPGSNANYVQMSIQNSTTAIVSSGINGSSLALAPAQSIHMHFLVPIVGWSSNTSMSSDTDTRVVAFSVNASNASGTPSGTGTINFGAASVDTHGAWNGSTTYTIPVSGWYDCLADTIVTGSSTTSGNWSIAIVGSIVGAIANGTDQSVGVAKTMFHSTANGMAYLTAGSTVAVTFSQSGIGSPVYQGGNQSFVIKRLSGPAVVAATESVNMSYTDTSGATISTSPGVFKFQTKQFDTHNAYSISTGLYTVPVSGKYRVSGVVSSPSVNLPNGNYYNMGIYHNGTSYTQNQMNGTGAGSTSYSVTLTGVVNCLAGDTLALYMNSEVATAANTTAGYNNLSIERVGN